MNIKTIAFVIIAGLVLPAVACAQAAPCKGYRRGDPNCAVRPPSPPAPPPPMPASPGATGTAIAAGAEKVVPKGLAYDLTLARTGSGDVIEFEPMAVAWTLKVDKFGISGADPESVAVDICPSVMPPPPDDQAACAHLQRANPGRTYHGQLSVPAPAAGTQSPLRLVVLRDAVASVGNNGQRENVAEQSIGVDSAARYDIALTRFEVLTTRSTSTDTVWISLQGQVKSNPPHPSDSENGCHIAGFAWCITNQWYGDAGDGSHEIRDVRVGPFTLVPERQSDLRFLFYLDNHGTSIAQEIGLGVANAFSKIGMLALGGYGLASGKSGAGGIATQLDSAMEQLHSAEFASCDGKLADGIVLISNKSIDNLPQFTLDAFTRANGEFSITLPEIYRNKDGDFRCDRRGGAYMVTYTIYRTSWRDWGFKAAY